MQHMTSTQLEKYIVDNRNQLTSVLAFRTGFHFNKIYAIRQRLNVFPEFSDNDIIKIILDNIDLTISDVSLMVGSPMCRIKELRYRIGFKKRGERISQAGVIELYNKDTSIRPKLLGLYTGWSIRELYKIKGFIRIPKEYTYPEIKELVSNNRKHSVFELAIITNTSRQTIEGVRAELGIAFEPKFSIDEMTRYYELYDNGMSIQDICKQLEPGRCKSLYNRLYSELKERDINNKPLILDAVELRHIELKSVLDSVFRAA